MNAITALAPTFKNQPTDPLLTPREAAAYIGVAENTLSIWRCVGRYNLQFLKVGRLVKYRQSVLDAFLEHSTVGGEV
jgi:excisionase family DNA binding protein